MLQIERWQLNLPDAEVLTHDITVAQGSYHVGTSVSTQPLRLPDHYWLPSDVVSSYTSVQHCCCSLEKFFSRPRRSSLCSVCQTRNVPNIAATYE
jgi:hypothetical protein